MGSASSISRALDQDSVLLPKTTENIMTPTQRLKQIRSAPHLSKTQRVILAQLTQAERLGRLAQAEPLLKQLHRELFPVAQARQQMMTQGMQRAWIYSQLTHPEQFLETKAAAIAVARRLEYDEQTAADLDWIGKNLGVAI